MEDWQKRAIERDKATQDIPEWMKRAMERDGGAATADIFGDAGPQPSQIDDSEDAPAMIRMEVEALEKPEDQLVALRKHYPDAKPYGDGNFIYTDKQGKTRQFNYESWFPGLGDFAAAAPEFGEFFGSIVGGAAGAAAGGTTGSVVPVFGTTAGALTLGALGAGSGGAAGREGTIWALNKVFGNEDTRTGKEQLVDAAQTAALNAGGEVAGRAVAQGAKAAWNGAKKYVIGGGVMDAPEKIAQRVQDFNDIGYQPTTGMVSGSDRQATLEHALKSTIPGQKIEGKIKAAHEAQANEFNRITTGLDGGRNPMSKAQIGEALKEQTQAAKNAALARSNQLYDKIPGNSPAIVTNTTELLNKLASERSAMGQFDQSVRGAQTDKAIATAKSIVADAETGWTLEKLKQARTYVGKLSQDTSDPIMKEQYDAQYRALTNDIQASADAAGPDALQKFNKANNHYRRLQSPEQFGKGGISDTLLNKDTDKIHDLIFNARKDGGNVIAAVRRNVVRTQGGKEAWDDISGSLIQRLGTKTTDDGAVFDSATFCMRRPRPIDFSVDLRAVK